MAAITITLNSVCAGGNHLRLQLTGDATGTKTLTLEELTLPIETEDKEAFLRVITKMARMGRTNAQARTLLQAGVTVTV